VRRGSRARRGDRVTRRLIADDATPTGDRRAPTLLHLTEDVVHISGSRRCTTSSGRQDDQGIERMTKGIRVYGYPVNVGTRVKRYPPSQNQHLAGETTWSVVCNKEKVHVF